MTTEITQRTDDESAQSGETVLQVEGMTKKFAGLVAVDNLSFSVENGEILGFIGPNGAGKSTTFNCIFGTYSPTSGTVTFQGEDVTGQPPHKMVKRGMARTFQTFRPLPDRDVLANVELAGVSDSLFTLSGLFGQSSANAEAVCRRVGLDDDLHKMPDELPHEGMIRLEVARAVATDPSFLLIDEPFAGLSSGEIEDLSKLFRDLRDNGMTLIVVDHNMRGLLDLIDRAIVINFGSKIAEGSPEEIINDEAVQDAYLGGDEI